MVAVIPIGEPKTFVQGDTVKWRYKHSDYDPATWTLTYSFVNQGSQTQVIAATDNGDGTHLLTISSTASKAFNAGTWHFQGRMNDGTNDETITRGSIVVERDFSITGQNYDARTHAAKVLDAIEAVLEDRATDDQASMSIGGRSISLMPVADLLQLRSRYKSEVEMEVAADRIAQGLGSGKRIGVRFK